MFDSPYRYGLVVVLSLYSYLNALFTEVYQYYGLRAPWYDILLSMVLITLFVWEGNRLVQQSIRRYFGWKVNIRFLLAFFVAGMAIAVLATLVTSYCAGKFLQLPPRELMISIKLSFTYGTRINLFLHILNGIVVFINEYRNKQLEAEELKRINIQAQLQSIRNQVNPHFLFNNLNVLSGMVIKDNPAANKFIEEFAKVYRHILNSQDKELNTLQTELDFIKPYIFLLEKRFPDSITVQLNIVEKYLHYYIVPVALQMLIENAIKHNVLSRARPLEISVYINEGGELTVKNNRQPKHQVEVSTQVGLKNIAQRYELTAGKNIKVVNDEHHFSVSLPLIHRPS